MYRRVRRYLKRLRKRKPKPAIPRTRWSVGIYGGASPLDLAPISGVENPVVSPDDVYDRETQLVADPFLARVGGWQMFVEVQSRRGEIGLATSDDGRDWQYRGIVLAEPFHLSYPQVFEWEGEVYMVPESHQAAAVRLYRADSYPDTWRYVGDLLSGEPFSDATLIRREERWWMWVEITDFRFESVHLFYSEDLEGPWKPHPKNPVVEADPRRARPAGRPIEYEGKLFRFVQDCVPIYGSGVRVMEVLELTPEDYREREFLDGPLLAGSGDGWNATGMHHLDAHRLPDGSWLAAVDGWEALEDPT